MVWGLNPTTLALGPTQPPRQWVPSYSSSYKVIVVILMNNFTSFIVLEVKIFSFAPPPPPPPRHIPFSLPYFLFCFHNYSCSVVYVVLEKPTG